MKKGTFFFVLITLVTLLFMSNISFAQQNDNLILKGNELLRNYQPPQPVDTEPGISPAQERLNKYLKDIEEAESKRYADTVIRFSSQYGSGSWSANQILGSPNVYPAYGDNASAWTFSTQDGQREWIELKFNNPAPISSIGIYETFNPGAVDTIYVKNPLNGLWDMVWSGTAAFAGAQSRIFIVDFPLTVYSVSEIRLAINSPAVGGWNEYDAVEISPVSLVPPYRVNTMPSNSTSGTYANALAGVPLAVWGNVNNGTPPYTYKLQYGDGAVDSGAVTDPHYIGADHTYATAGPYTMRLEVWDNGGAGTLDYDESIIKVYPLPTQQIQVNMAIEKGLLYLYLNQYSDGHWYDNSGSTGATGMALLSFEENGHLHTNDFNTDIYAEYISRGLNYLFANSTTHSISTQYAGNPDSDGDGLGVYTNYENYANGIGCLAILGAHSSAASAMLDIIEAGIYSGQSYYDFIVDALDQIAFSQTDSVSGSQRGGWRYNINTANYGSSDNSAVQWPGLVMEAAEKSWGMAIQPWVKDELLHWLIASYDTSDGGFGYQSYNQWNNIAKTASGIGTYALLGWRTDSLNIQKAINFLDAHWTDAFDNNWYNEHLSGNLYAMYAVAKGMRIMDNRAGVTFIGLRNWYNEYVTHLLTHPTWKQQADGRWDGNTWDAGSTGLTTAFAVLILTQGVVIAPPVAVIDPVSPKPTNFNFKVYGGNSYHQNPTKSIVEWKWDWDASNGLNWDAPNAVGINPTNPGYPATGFYTITLRVKDDSPSPLYDFESIVVSVQDTANNPPVAVAIPPGGSGVYSAKVGEPIFLDGSYSYDPDQGDSVVAYSWDTNGDGLFGDALTDTLTVVFLNEYQGQVGLKVYDTHGDSSSNLAYITIVASRKDLYVTQYSVSPTKLNPGDTLQIIAVFKNNDTSNTNANNVLVRFYDDDPLVSGNRLGGDYYVNLPVAVSDTVNASIQISPNRPVGTMPIWVWLDANNQVAEWDELNNIESTSIAVGIIKKPINLLASSNGVQSVLLNWIDQSLNETGFVIERKLGDTVVAKLSYGFLDTVSANINTYTDGTVVDDTRYSYRLQAYNSYTTSDYSNQSSVVTPIPVELISFNAAVEKNHQVKINWSTATETNNKGFDVERKFKDGVWEKVGYIPGKGTTTEISKYSFSDNLEKKLYSGEILYRLVQIDFDGVISYSDQISVDVSFIPTEYSLHQNFPNPFNPSTTIRYDLPEASRVKLVIYNALGEVVEEIVNEMQEVGYYEKVWNASSKASGLYIVLMQAEGTNNGKNFKTAKKMLLIK
ncbi:MAG: hypothetical protein K8H86_05100 [Ignavibacteriaceae bacterium]|nr:hypothetical protein [Ignavibacteriaceae bacterium]